MSKPVYALVGEDNFLQIQKLQAIIKSVPTGVQRTDFDGQSADLASVLDELRSFAMFGNGKLVVIRNSDEFVSKYREQLENYLSDPAENSTLLLRFTTLPKTQRIYKLIDKTGKIESCEPPSAAALPGWIQKHAQATYGLQMQTDAAKKLAELIGGDLGRLDCELAKLAIVVESGKQLQAGDLVNHVAFQRDQEMWALTNALAAGNSSEAIQRWRQLLQTDNSTEFRAVTWLTMWLEDVAHVIGCNERGEQPNFRKLWRYQGEQMNKFLANCRRLGADGLCRAVENLTLLDRQTKTGIGQAATNIERYILDLAQSP
jgi:DNA polymerase III delta subunit